MKEEGLPVHFKPLSIGVFLLFFVLICVLANTTLLLQILNNKSISQGSNRKKK